MEKNSPAANRLSIVEVCIEGNPSSTEKYHLMALGLHEEGAIVTMLWFLHSVDGMKAFQDVYGDDAAYTVDPGVNGQLYIGNSKIGKLWNNISIGMAFGRRLAIIIRKNNVDIVVIPAYHLELVLPAAVVCKLFRAKLVPNVMEYNPALPNFNQKTNLLHRLSWRLMLRAADGILAISEYLEKRLKSDVGKSVFVLPAITHVDSAISYRQNPKKASGSQHKLLYASSNAYIDLLEFVIQALALINRDDFVLVITGNYQQQQVANILAMAGSMGIQDRVLFTGYLSRNELVKEQLDSTVLLMPLLDHDQHRARFPQKILEYMMIPRPIITSAVGEVGRLFRDEETAFIDHTLTPSGYAFKINEALQNADKAERIAKAGQRFVTEEFDYRLWGRKLSNYFCHLRR